MSKKRHAILALHREGNRQSNIVRLLRMSRQTVSAAIKRFTELGHEGDCSGRGRKRTVNTARNRQLIKKRVNRKSRQSLRKTARKTGITHESVRQMIKRQLGLKPYKLRRRQLLTDDNKRVQRQKCRALRRATGGRWGKIIFTDEKLFTIEASHNSQTNRIWSSEALGPSAIIERRQNP